MIATLLERWPSGLPRAAAGLILALALAALGAQVWHWQREAADRAASSRGRATDASAAQAVDPLPVILSSNLFGAAQSTQASAAPGPTRQATGYTLRAAFAADAGGGGAIIEATGAEARWYEKGDALPDGARLAEVHADHVILERDGARERLDFPKLNQLSTVAAPAAAGVGTGAPGGATLERGTAEPIPADATPEQKAQIIRQRLEELRNRART